MEGYIFGFISIVFAIVQFYLRKKDNRNSEEKYKQLLKSVEIMISGVKAQLTEEEAKEIIEQAFEDDKIRMKIYEEMEEARWEDEQMDFIRG